MNPDRAPGARARLQLRPLVALAALAMACAIAGTASLATAQSAEQPAWLVGAITSSSAGGPLGAEQARAAEFSAASLARQGVFGAPFTVDIRDDGGNPRRAEALARELIEAGALALVCCTTASASERVSALAEASGVVLLSLDGTAEDRHWTFPLRPDTRTQLTAAAVFAAERGETTLALMTLDNAFGDEAADAFERALGDAGRQAAGTVRYPPSATVLTPEALWAATRVPSAVVVWGLQADTHLALDGLRRRGWLGPVHVRPEAVPAGVWSRIELTTAGPTSPPAAGDVWWQVRSAAAPVSVAALLPPEHPNQAAAIAALDRLTAAGVRPDPVTLASVARVGDALVLAQRAFEQVAALGLPPGLPLATLRQAVQDALVSAPPQALAAGTYEARSSDARFARWQGLVVITTR